MPVCHLPAVQRKWKGYFLGECELTANLLFLFQTSAHTISDQHQGFYVTLAQRLASLNLRLAPLTSQIRFGRRWKLNFMRWEVSKGRANYFVKYNYAIKYIFVFFQRPIHPSIPIQPIPPQWYSNNIAPWWYICLWRVIVQNLCFCISS